MVPFPGMSRLAAMLFGIGLLVAPAVAQARPNMDVQHVQGHDATWIVGWNEAVVTLENKDQPAWRGEIVVDPTYDHRSLDRPTVRVSAHPILPDIATGWSGAVMVMIPSDVLSRLQGRQLDALAQFVVAGGSLSISVIREEDLRSSNLKMFLGGEARLVGTEGLKQ